MTNKYFLPVFALFAGLALGFAFYFVEKNRMDAMPPKITIPKARKPATTGLAGAGVVEPLTENINVGPPVPGVVTWVIGFDRVGQPVAAGEVLFRLDDRTQRAQLEISKAALESSRRQLDRLRKMPRPEEVTPLAARFAETKVRVAEQEDQLGRAQRLYRSKALSLDEYRRTLFAYEAAKEQNNKAEADLRLIQGGAWSADLAVSEGALKQAEAAVRQVETELEKLDVKALAAGQLLQVNIRPGEFVSSVPGQNLIVLGNVDDLHVRVDVDEDDVPRFRPNAPATAYLRGQEDYAYRLDFVRVEPYLVPKKSLTRDNTERNDTRVLQVIFKVKAKPDLAHRVYVGQQMDVFLDQAPEADPKRPSAEPKSLHSSR